MVYTDSELLILKLGGEDNQTLEKLAKLTLGKETQSYGSLDLDCCITISLQPMSIGLKTKKKNHSL